MMPKKRKAKPRKSKPGPKEERLIISRDPEQVLARLLKSKPPKNGHTFQRFQSAN